jgi:cystathionine beta-synthase
VRALPQDRKSTNPGGSIKDRIGLSMIEDAEQPRTDQARRHAWSRARPATPASALALVAQQKGYNLILVVPDKMSREKIFNLKAMGAEVVLTRSDVAKGHPAVLPGHGRTHRARNPGRVSSSTSSATRRTRARTRIRHRAGDLAANGHDMDAIVFGCGRSAP